MTLPQYITINGTSYASANLNDTAKMQAANVQIVDAELARLQQQIAITQTARNTYIAALVEAVKGKDESAPAAKPKKPRAPAKPKAETAAKATKAKAK